MKTTTESPRRPGSAREALQRTAVEKERQYKERAALLETLKAQEHHLSGDGIPVDAGTILQQIQAQARRAAEAAVTSVTPKGYSPQSKLIKESQAAIADVQVPLGEPEEPQQEFVPLKEEVVKYMKGIQTDEAEQPISKAPTMGLGQQFTEGAMGTTEEFPEVGHEQKEPSEEEKQEKTIEVTVMPEERRRALFADPDFISFAERSTMVLEKALNMNRIVDIYRDYTAKEDGAGGGVEDFIGPITTYEDSRYSSRRSVNGLMQVPRMTDQFLACYGPRRDSSIGEPEGVVLKWGLDNPTRPEHALISPSASVTCIATSNAVTSHNLIFGGTRNGAVLMWDPRAQQRPVQKTRLSRTNPERDHQTQIQAAYIIGSGNSAILATIDMDFRVCYWSIAVSLTLVGTADLRDVNSKGGLLFASCLRGNKLFSGWEDGSIFEATLNVDNEVKTIPYNTEPEARARFHRGPITGMDMQLHNQRVGNAEMILTSSIDWTVKLWDATVPHGGYVPIHTFDMHPGASLVSDVKWSPSHPSIFGAVTGNGYLNLWDLNTSWQNPVLSSNLASGGGGLTKLGFLMEGKRIMAGSTQGKIYTGSLIARCHTLGSDQDLHVFELRHEQARLKAEPRQKESNLGAAL